MVTPQARSGKHLGTARQRWPPIGPRSSLKGTVSKSLLGTSASHTNGKPDGFDFGVESSTKKQESPKSSRAVILRTP